MSRRDFSLIILLAPPLALLLGLVSPALAALPVLFGVGWSFRQSRSLANAFSMLLYLLAVMLAWFVVAFLVWSSLLTAEEIGTLAHTRI